MSFDNITSQPSGRDFRSLFERPALETGFFLTVEDRVGIKRLLANDGTRHAPNRPLLDGLLRHKLRTSRGAVEPPEPELVVAGRLITFMISGGRARTGVLSMAVTPSPGHILVASLLGATLIGMRRLQKVPLLRDDGQIDVIVVLDVGPAPDTDTI